MSTNEERCDLGSFCGVINEDGGPGTREDHAKRKFENSKCHDFVPPERFSPSYDHLVPKEELPPQKPGEFRVGQIWRTGTTYIKIVFKVTEVIDGGKVISYEVLAGKDGFLSWRDFAPDSDFAFRSRLVEDVETPASKYEPEGLRVVIENLKKERDDARMVEGLAVAGRERAEERLEEYRGKVIDLENEVDRLSDELKVAENDFSEAQENANQYRQETVDLKAQIKDLQDRLRYERGRAADALKVADNAAMGIGAISRTLHSVTDLTERLTRKLEK